MAAIPLVLKEHSTVFFVMAGRDLGEYILPDRDCWAPGMLARTDLFALYRASVVVVAPSIWPESFGRIALESMACGTPVIASRLGGYLDQIEHGANGWLVTPGDSQELATAILCAVRQIPLLRILMRHECRNTIQKRFHYSTTTDRTRRFYREIIAKGAENGKEE